MQHKEFSHINISVTNIDLAFKKRCALNWHYSSKDRNSFGFLYIVDGTADFQYGGKNFCAGQHDIVFLRKGSTYSFQSGKSENLEYIILNFQAADENELFSLPFDGIVGRSESIGGLFEDIENSWYYKDIGHIMMCKALLYQIIYTLLHKKVYKVMKSRNYTRFAAAAEYMDNYFDKNITIEQLAQICNLSVTHFRRGFKQIYERTPIEYLSELRINRAKDLLRTGLYSITQVAEMTGFNSVYYFSRRFKEIVGAAPKDY